MLRVTFSAWRYRATNAAICFGCIGHPQDIDDFHLLPGLQAESHGTARRCYYPVAASEFVGLPLSTTIGLDKSR